MSEAYESFKKEVDWSEEIPSEKLDELTKAADKAVDELIHDLFNLTVDVVIAKIVESGSELVDSATYRDYLRDYIDIQLRLLKAQAI